MSNNRRACSLAASTAPHPSVQFNHSHATAMTEHPWRIVALIVGLYSTSDSERSQPPACRSTTEAKAKSPSARTLCSCQISPNLSVMLPVKCAHGGRKATLSHCKKLVVELPPCASPSAN